MSQSQASTSTGSVLDEPRIKPRRVINRIYPTDSIVEVVRKIQIPTWRAFFDEEKDTLENISEEIEENEIDHGPVFPARKDIFRAYIATPLDQVKVVIIGQDPYPKEGIAVGLSFSCPPGEAIQPSLRTIYKELQDNYKDFRIPKDGDLSPWAEQGVFLLNSRLTVHEGMPLKHNRTWLSFTSQTVEYIKRYRPDTIFLVWGRQVQKDLADALDGANVLTAAHPSPLNTRGGFLGCKHFLKANIFLQKAKLAPVDWTLVSEDATSDSDSDTDSDTDSDSD